MGGGDINYPVQPTYGEGMEDAMRAQMEQLLGQGDYAEIYRKAGYYGGNLGDILEGVEAPIRKKTAQIDTDVLRQTLLGSEQNVQRVEQPDGSFKYGVPGGQSIVPQGETPKGSSGDFVIHKGTITDQNTGAGTNILDWAERYGLVHPLGTYKVGKEGDEYVNKPITLKGAQALGLVDESGEGVGAVGKAWGGDLRDNKNFDTLLSTIVIRPDGTIKSSPDNRWTDAMADGLPDLLEDLNTSGSMTEAFLGDFKGKSDVGDSKVVMEEFSFKNPVTGESWKEGDVVRSTTGLVDLVGDSRAIKSATRQDDYESYVRDNEGNMAAFQAENKRLADAGEAPVTMEQWGQTHYENVGKAAGDEMPTRYGYAEEDPGRRAGFDPSGEFLGLSAFGEDIQAQNLSRQRQRDLEDVARLSPLYSDIMQEYKPGTQQALEDARGVLKAREGAMTGAGGSLSDASTQVRESYLRILGREPDAAGLASWTQSLQQGASVEDMNLAFADARASGEGGPVMEGRLQAQARALGRAASEGLDTGKAIAAPKGMAKTGYTAASAAEIDPLSAATKYNAKANLSSGRVGGDYEATRTISRETQTPLDFKNQGLLERDLRDYRARAAGGGAVSVMGVPVNNEEEFYNEMAKSYKVDVPYDTFKRGYTTGTEDIQSRGTGDIRAALMEDAYTGLGEGLTAREQENIEQASRRRATALGRTFDRGSIADEVQSRVLEDRNRQAQNRAYAQQVLKQEAQMQTSDMSRNLQAQMQNQAALNQAAQYGVGAGLQREQVGAQFAQQKALSDQAAANQAAQFGVGAGLQQQQFGAGQDIAAQAMNREATMKGSEFDILQDVARGEQNIGRELAAAESDLERDYRQRFSQEQLAQQGTLGYIDAATRLAALEDTSTLDPFQAVLGRTGGGSLQAGQQVFGQAGYGLQSAPQYLNPEAGLGFIQNQATNAANMYNAQVGADATKTAGMWSGLGSLGGSLGAAAIMKCWVAREVYGEHNPAWLLFRNWLDTDAPRWLDKLYMAFGERFANFISNKPRLKARIRLWMDSKIGR